MNDFMNFDTDPEIKIGTLPSVTEVDRVFFQADGKLYRTNAILAFLDNRHLDFSQVVLEGAQPLPVYDEEKRILGFASIELRNGRVIAQIGIDYACPERLSAELQDGVKFYPRIVGYYLIKPCIRDKFLDLDPAKPIVSLIHIKQIILSIKGSGDFRLGSLGEPILM